MGCSYSFINKGSKQSLKSPVVKLIRPSRRIVPVENSFSARSAKAIPSVDRKSDRKIAVNNRFCFSPMNLPDTANPNRIIRESIKADIQINKENGNQQSSNENIGITKPTEIISPIGTSSLNLSSPLPKNIDEDCTLLLSFRKEDTNNKNQTRESNSHIISDNLIDKLSKQDNFPNELHLKPHIGSPGRLTKKSSQIVKSHGQIIRIQSHNYSTNEIGLDYLGDLKKPALMKGSTEYRQDVRTLLVQLRDKQNSSIYNSPMSSVISKNNNIEIIEDCTFFCEYCCLYFHHQKDLEEHRQSKLHHISVLEFKKDNDNFW